MDAGMSVEPQMTDGLVCCWNGGHVPEREMLEDNHPVGPMTSPSLRAKLGGGSPNIERNGVPMRRPMSNNGLTKARKEEEGPYTVEWENYATCRGPKSLNMSTYTLTLKKQPDGSYRYLFNISFTDTVRIEEIRMNVNTMKGGKKQILWNVNVNKPCQHYMLAAMLETYFGVKNCWVKKGEILADLPLTELMVKYIGPSFFYGDYLFKVVVNSKKANLACLIFDPKFKKKTKAA